MSASATQGGHNKCIYRSVISSGDLLQTMKVQEEVERRERELAEERCRQIEYEERQRLNEERQRLEAERRKQSELDQQEHDLRRKILHKMKMIEEKRGEQQREELRRKVAGGSVKLKSAVAVKK